MSRTRRLSVTLHDEAAATLEQLAVRAGATRATLAAALLADAIDAADLDPRAAAALLDGIDGAFERARLGLAQGASGDTIPLAELCR